MTNTVMGFHYTLKDGDGTVIDTSDGGNPLLFMVGAGHIIPGLETEIVDLAVGDSKNVEVKAAEAYGEVIAELQMTVQRNQFPGDAVLNVGDQFKTSNEPTAPVFRITAIDGDEINIDGNHPLAGQDLFFDIEVTERREATEEEMAHGHAHGPGGHEH